MNDPFSSAISSLADNVNGVATGQNSLFAPQVANIFGFNVQGVPIISARDYFLAQMETWATAIPLTTQWIVVVSRYPSCVNTAILQGLEKTDGSKRGFDVDRAFQILTSYPLQKIVGCLFAQGVTLPAEEVGIEQVNINNSRGFLSVPTVGKRADNHSLQIDFLETNSSFTDLVIRPWVIATSHYGFVARDPNDPTENAKNVKTIINVMQYTRTLHKVSMIPRKIWTFFNCAPTTVSQQEMTYDRESFGRLINKTTWTFSHYTVENNLYFPLRSIIDRISRGQIPGILAPKPKNLNIAGLF